MTLLSDFIFRRRQFRAREPALLRQHGQYAPRDKAAAAHVFCFLAKPAYQAHDPVGRARASRPVGQPRRSTRLAAIAVTLCSPCSRSAVVLHIDDTFDPVHVFRSWSSSHGSSP